MPPDSTPLTQFVLADDPAYSWSLAQDDRHAARMHIVSQSWQGAPWTHSVTIARPEKAWCDTAILIITGGEPNSADESEARWLCDATGMPVATLYNIPNQPLYGLTEDDLIAETFVRYLETHDNRWPLLLPMVKAVYRAMDAVQEHSSKQGNSISKFVLTGSSKRGWTTWLAAAAGDERIVGIAPAAYDNLNVPVQLRHQIESWGEHSEMIQPYTARGLHESVGTEQGQALVSMVDPYCYRDSLALPKLIVTGTNDPYWSVDATSLYWDGLVGPKYIRAVPNGGHGEFGEAALATVAAFVRSCAKQIEMPVFSWRHELDATWLDIRSPWKSARFWVAESESLDFRASRWAVTAECGPGGGANTQREFCFRYPRSRSRQAVLAEVRFEIDGLGFDLTTTVRVVG